MSMMDFDDLVGGIQCANDLRSHCEKMFVFTDFAYIIYGNLTPDEKHKMWLRYLHTHGMVLGSVVYVKDVAVVDREVIARLKSKVDSINRTSKYDEVSTYYFDHQSFTYPYNLEVRNGIGPTVAVTYPEYHIYCVHKYMK